MDTMLEGRDEKYEAKEITYISWDGADIKQQVNDWIKENYPNFNVKDGERLEIKVEIRVVK